MKKYITLFAILLCQVTLTEAIADTGTSTAADTTAKKEIRYAVVDLSSIYMRAEPDYESALETQELMGTVVEVVSEKGYWREIVSPQPYVAWCTEKGLVEMSEEEIKEYADAPKCMFTNLYGHMYDAPNEDAPTLCDLVGGDVLRLAGGKGEIAGQAGNDEKGRAGNDEKGKAGKGKGRWTQVMLPSGITGWVKSEWIKPWKGFRSIAMGEGDAGSISDAQMEEIIATAFRLKGVPYLWGGMTPKGVDCSGLVRWSYLMNGILLPRNASQIINCGDEVPLRLPKDGQAAGIEHLRRGDLVFFGTPAKEGGRQRVTHIGIYIGNNHIIHSSHLVRVNSLIPGDEDYYENSHKLIAARRL